MCDSRLPAPACRRSLPDSVCALPGRALSPLLLALCLLACLPLSAAAQTLTVSPATSTDGAYTVSWGVSRCFYVPLGGSQVCRVLEERAGSSGTWAVVSGIGNAATSKAFTGKASGTYYYRLLIAGRALGGPVSVTVTATPPPKSPPATPARPALTPGDGRLAVSWTAPDDNGSPITRYSMHYKARAATALTTHPLATAGARTSTTITGLTNGTTYLLQVRAHNAGGISAFSATARGTPRGAPDAPAKPALTPGDGRLAVSWTAPDDNGSAITRYSMHYKARAATAWTTHPLANAGARTSTTITGLTNGTTYLACRCGRTMRGVSPRSAPRPGARRAGRRTPRPNRR